MTKNEFTITNTTKGKLPRLPFEQIKNAVLGNAYSLSLVFIGDARSQKLNNTHRGKNKPTDVLSFSLKENLGEIFINQNVAKKKAPLYDRNLEKFVGYLFIHGLFHLKGMDHSSTMESEEAQVREKFSI